MSVKYPIVSLLFSLMILLAATSCKEKKKPEAEEKSTVELNKSSIEAFGAYLENALALNNPEPLNEAFDKAYIKQQISDNSIVYSALDADFGRAFFESNFRQGDKALEVIDQGGDFRFVGYYEKNGEHHIVFRIYQDYNLWIDDYVVDTADGKIKIKDGFSLLNSTTFVNQVRYNMLFDIMNRTHPEGATRNFNLVQELLQKRKGADALKVLEENRLLLAEYPLFTRYYLQSLMQSDPKNYISQLEEMDGKVLDYRSVLLHKFLYNVNTGNVRQAEETAMKLIEITGDDPIYLFMFGVANFYAGDYETALYCYENALTGMRMIWDIWHGSLACYHKLKDKENFDALLEKGKELYGLGDNDLEEIRGDIES